MTTFTKRYSQMGRFSQKITASMMAHRTTELISRQRNPLRDADSVVAATAAALGGAFGTGAIALELPGELLTRFRLDSHDRNGGLSCRNLRALSYIRPCEKQARAYPSHRSLHRKSARAENYSRAVLHSSE